MKTKTKYYTPDLEEFHIGFECELLIELYGGTVIPIDQHRETWKKYILTSDDIIYFFNRQTTLDIPLFRVKYLDKEDVESLGIKVLHECGDLYDFEYDLKLGDEYLGTFLEGFDGKPNIEIYNTNYIIKNKSELKTLLKQLEIN